MSSSGGLRGGRPRTRSRLETILALVPLGAFAFTLYLPTSVTCLLPGYVTSVDGEWFKKKALPRVPLRGG